jgi:hypothetical protein
VSGGGWLVPAEASRVGLVVGEKLHFGFQWKYKSGSTIPEGNLQLKQDGGISFHAKSAQWMVISGGTATIEGRGELDKVAGYRFRMSVRDGDPDSATFAIWADGGAPTAPAYRGGNDVGSRGESIQVKQ